MKSTKHPKKNENYNEIFEKPFNFNLQTVSTARRHCRSSLSQPEVVDCGWEVAERVKKTISVPKAIKKEELPMKLLDDPKIPTADKNLEDHTTPTSLSTPLLGYRAVYTSLCIFSFHLASLNYIYEKKLLFGRKI
jgi:hypothetical protein